jgi:hypothetical protein
MQCLFINNNLARHFLPNHPLTFPQRGAGPSNAPLTEVESAVHWDWGLGELGLQSQPLEAGHADGRGSRPLVHYGYDPCESFSVGWKKRLRKRVKPSVESKSVHSRTESASRGAGGGVGEVGVETLHQAMFCQEVLRVRVEWRN